MRQHVVLRAHSSSRVFPTGRIYPAAVSCHHERWDGDGYPLGLAGADIPLLGRIMAVVDAYSAMILDRPYRKALPHEEAVAELRRGAGTQFDPDSAPSPSSACLSGLASTRRLIRQPQTAASH